MEEQKYLDPKRFQINEVQEKKSSSEQKKRVFDPVRQYTQADSIRKQIQESLNKGEGAHAYLHNEILYITDKQAKIAEFESKDVKPITVEHALWQQEFGENTRLALDLAGVEKPLDKGIGTSEVQKSLDKPYTEWVMEKIPDHLERHDTPIRNNDCGGYAMLVGADHDMKSQTTKDLVLEMKRYLVKNGLIGSTGKMIEFGRYKTANGNIENITKGSGERAFLWLCDTKHEIEAGRGLRVYGFQDHNRLIVAQDVIESDPGKKPVCIYQTGGKFKHFEALSQKVDVSSQNSRVADEGFVSDTPNGILSIQENKWRKVDAPAEPKLDKLLPLNMMGSPSDHSLTELKKRILKKEKDYLEVKISLKGIYKDVEKNYPKVSRESPTRCATREAQQETSGEKD